MQEFFFKKKSISNRNEKKRIVIDKPTYLGLSTLELSKISMYDFWCDYAKPKYGEKLKLCYVDTVSLYK